MAINGESGGQIGTIRTEEAETKKEPSTAKVQEQKSTAAPANFSAAATPSTATNTAPPGPLPAGFDNMSQALMGSSGCFKDSLSTLLLMICAATNEQLKNMMTAWYYAGYYTGFFEGQSKAWTDMQPQDG